MTKIRIPQAADAAALVELARRFPSPAPSTNEVLTDILRRKLSDPFSYLLVAESAAGVVGYVSGHRHAAFYAGGDTAWVDEILVEESSRSTGVGRLLMAAFENQATADGCKLVSLATAAGASPFYLKLGYATKAGYYKKYLGSAEQRQRWTAKET